jgi:hypothetical protein
LSIKGGPGHVRERRRQKGGKGKKKSISIAQAKGKRAVEMPTWVPKRGVWRPTRSTSCKLQKEDRESSAPRSEDLSLDSYEIE